MRACTHAHTQTCTNTEKRMFCELINLFKNYPFITEISFINFKAFHRKETLLDKTKDNNAEKF